MKEAVKPVSEKPNTVHEFTVQFFADSVSIDGTVLPLGQVSTDVLNMKPETIQSLQNATRAFMDAVEKQLWSADAKKDAALAAAVQDKMNDAFDMMSALPLYRHLDLDKDFARNLLPLMLRREPDTFARMCNPNSMEAAFFKNMLRAYVLTGDEALSFRTYIAYMLDQFFEGLKKRNNEHYAIGVYRFFSEADTWMKLTAMTGLPNFMLSQTQETLIEYTTMPNPANAEEYMIAERMVFNTLGAFLHVDFFRGLMRGNAPRRCHNCDKFFLLTGGYDIRYCNNIAPGETERTCRRVGAHRKEARRIGETPIQAEYRKVYSRLKTRKVRGTITVEEWNRRVALAQDYKAQAERGKMSEFAFKRLCEKM